MSEWRGQAQEAAAAVGQGAATRPPLWRMLTPAATCKLRVMFGAGSFRGRGGSRVGGLPFVAGIL